ncbi:MAG: glycine cleavage system protein H [Sulfobacillus benefaciens]|uniref:Glycine cleavage system H protein n=1 Tax=Sulfobacillus benefaciens TaxID=453960 RepID=A0A2T2XGM3_9FIRM|nr:MAG: glycine cleavage system protein H [Sulfobacillus benefaciens]
MNLPKNLRYTTDHEWIDEEGRVGITEYAQEALGDVVFVELPQVGRSLKAGEAFGVVESVKSVSDLYSPVAGVVVAVNIELSSQPELVNLDPYGAGWIIKLDPEMDSAELLLADAYRSQIEGA